jgi:hypothetical protein
MTGVARLEALNHGFELVVVDGDNLRIRTRNKVGGTAALLV